MFSSREASRYMAKPTEAAWKQLQNIGRYIRVFPRARQLFETQDMSTHIEAIVDLDWAGCGKTRKSTSGGLVRFGKHVLRAWSSSQSVIALSSGEA